MNFFENARQAKLVRHHEKQENITRLIGYFLDRLSVKPAGLADVRRVSLIARSPSSPVARAIVASASELRAQNVTIEVVFTRLDPAEHVAPWLALALAPAGEAPLATLRSTRLPAITEAHEQMVLGTDMCWTGDCMRREPENRDAYEMFDTFHRESARRAANAFRWFWEGSALVPVSVIQRFAPKPSHGDAAAVDPAVTAAQGGPSLATATVSTRH